MNLGTYQTQNFFFFHTAMMIRTTIIESRSAAAADPAPAPAPITVTMYKATI